jgi:hypothetical protein
MKDLRELGIANNWSLLIHPYGTGEWERGRGKVLRNEF